MASTIAAGIPGTRMPAWLYDNGGPLTGSRIGDIGAYQHTEQVDDACLRQA